MCFVWYLFRQLANYKLRFVLYQVTHLLHSVDFITKIFPYTTLKIGFFVQLTGYISRFSIHGQEVDMAK